MGQKSLGLYCTFYLKLMQDMLLFEDKLPPFALSDLRLSVEILMIWMYSLGQTYGIILLTGEEYLGYNIEFKSFIHFVFT